MRRRWIKIATIDVHCYGSFGPYIPNSARSPHELTLRKIVIRRGHKFDGRPAWTVWGIPEEVVDR